MVSLVLTLKKNLKLERQAIDFFLDSLGLELVSHNYLTSNGKLRKVSFVLFPKIISHLKKIFMNLKVDT